jgi:HEAT repeat protein
VPEVRTTALSVLGKVGDASSVPRLAELAANTQGDEQAAARESLALVHGPGVDGAIAAAISSSTGNVQLELIRAAGERASPQLADVLMKIAQGPDRAASQAAIRASECRGLSRHRRCSPAGAEALLGASTRAQRCGSEHGADEASPHPNTAAVMSAYQAAGDKQTRLTLIDVMGQISTGEALPVLRAALKDPDPEIARSAILALTAWTTPEPLPDLLEVARGESNATRQILALRGYIRVIGVPSDRSPAESVGLLKLVWPLAKQTAEKRAILALLQLYPTPDALGMANSAAADPDVAKEAKGAADRFARSACVAGQ